MYRRLALFSCLAFISSCDPPQRLASPDQQGDQDPADLSTDDSSSDSPDLSDLSVPADLMSYDAGPPDLVGACAPPATGIVCANPIGATDGCLVSEQCGPSGAGNGLDDNCNGQVDETCTCSPGAVQKCFVGAPGKRGKGACTDGTQTCNGGEFGTWGPCTGGISPQAESCDKLDNDCNGCADDGLCCAGALDCPAPGDPRIAPVQPYTTVSITGNSFYPDPGAHNWNWTVTGGPCDVLFSTTTGTPPKQSFTVTGATTANPTFKFTLSGDYTVTFTVIGGNGTTYTCSWVQHVRGPGVRFELCWDRSGSVDIDLHVHKADTLTKWFEDPVGTINADDCYYRNCKASNYPSGTAQPLWGYTDSTLNQCVGGPSGPAWMSNLGACHNPRLDIDNISTIGVPENANIDRPKNHETFRSMVHYFTGSLEVHPLVNVYCGGNLKATYGQAPNTLGPCPGASCFNIGRGLNKGLMWRVADVEALTNAMGDTVDCNVTAIHPPGSAGGYYVTDNDSTF